MDVGNAEQKESDRKDDEKDVTHVVHHLSGTCARDGAGRVNRASGAPTVGQLRGTLRE
jgi:hypothetical protein